MWLVVFATQVGTVTLSVLSHLCSKGRNPVWSRETLVCSHGWASRTGYTLSPTSQCEVGAVSITGKETEAGAAPHGFEGLGCMEGTVVQAPGFGPHPGVPPKTSARAQGSEHIGCAGWCLPAALTVTLHADAVN